MNICLLRQSWTKGWRQIHEIRKKGRGRGVRDLQLAESYSQIWQIPVYRTNKMKNTVTGKTAE